MGSWKIMVSFEPRMRFSRGGRGSQDFRALEAHAPLDRGIAREQAHGRHEDLGLARSGLAHDADALAGRHLQRDLPHRGQCALPRCAKLTQRSSMLEAWA